MSLSILDLKKSSPSSDEKIARAQCLGSVLRQPTGGTRQIGKSGMGTVTEPVKSFRACCQVAISQQLLLSTDVPNEVQHKGGCTQVSLSALQALQFLFISCFCKTFW